MALRDTSVAPIVPRRDNTAASERPSDQAARENNITRVSVLNGSLSADSSDAATLHTNNSGQVKYITGVTFSVWDGEHPGIRLRFYVNDSGGNRLTDLVRTGSDVDIVPGQPVRVPDGGTVNRAIKNPTFKQIQFDIAVQLRDEV